MKRTAAFLLWLGTAGAQAHESIIPHHHPHGPSLLPGLDLIGVAALILALGVIVYARRRSRRAP